MIAGTNFYNYFKSQTPPSVVAKINEIYSQVDPLLISFYRTRTGWNKPIPPFELRRITAKRSVDDYVKSGERIVRSLIDGLNSVGEDINNFPNILDFGCGAGRQVQYFYENKKLKITGCDPNESHIQWLSPQYPLANFSVSKFDPPLPFAAESFDLVYSVSVFTHLSEKAQFNWLTDLKRVLRPGGIALLTTLGQYAAQLTDKTSTTKRRDINEPEIFSKALLEQKFLFYVPKSYHQLNKFINPDSVTDEEMYGIAWHSQEYLTNNWSQYFEILNIIPGCIDSSQDLVILRKSSEKK